MVKDKNIEGEVFKTIDLVLDKGQNAPFIDDVINTLLQIRNNGGKYVKVYIGENQKPVFKGKWQSQKEGELIIS